jgi:hypothetical protein
LYRLRYGINIVINIPIALGSLAIILGAAVIFYEESYYEAARFAKKSVIIFWILLISISAHACLCIYIVIFSHEYDMRFGLSLVQSICIVAIATALIIIDYFEKPMEKTVTHNFIPTSSPQVGAMVNRSDPLPSFKFKVEKRFNQRTTPDQKSSTGLFLRDRITTTSVSFLS